MTTTTTTVKKLVVDSARWSCNVHSSSVCYMTFIEGVQYHVVPLSKNNFCRYGVDKYNSPPEFLVSGQTQEFWEPIAPQTRPMVCAFDRCQTKYDRTIVQKMFSRIFHKLWADEEFFVKYKTADDMVHKHIITDGLGNLALCNKHLLNKRRPEKPKSSGSTTQARTSKSALSISRRNNKYLMRSWEKKIYQSLYPNNDEHVPMGTRQWVNKALKQIATKT